MINWETIKSLYNDKPTLLEWLKKVEAALTASVLQVVDVEKVSTSEIKFNFIFEDGTNIETPIIALPYEIQNVAIVNGHLILTLESGQTLDAGNLGAVSGFSIDAAQHLIVTYQDGTTQDLGNIFNGNVAINGNLSVSGGLSPNGGLYSASGKIDAFASIVEKMTGYSFIIPQDVTLDWTPNYVGCVKNGDKLTFVIAGKFTYHSETGNVKLGYFIVPQAIGNKLIPYMLSGNAVLTQAIIPVFDSRISYKSIMAEFLKTSATQAQVDFLQLGNYSLVDGTDYYFRYEATFLLSDSL